MRYKFITVGYIPSDGETDLANDTTYLFDGPLAAGFEKLLDGAAIIEPDVMQHHSVGAFPGDPMTADAVNVSSTRATMMTQVGVKDPYAAEFLASFYQTVEQANWENLEGFLDPGLQWLVELNDWGDEGSGLNRKIANDRRSFIRRLMGWRNKYRSCKFDIKWANVSPIRAAVNFDLIGDGQVLTQVLTLYEFKRDHGKYRISSLFNYKKSDPAIMRDFAGSDSDQLNH